ncbi:SMAD7 family protein [Megaselia abdita]
MFFPSKKKRLWRARLKQSAATNNDLHPSRQRHLLNNFYQPSYPTLTSPIGQNQFDYIQKCQNCLNISYVPENPSQDHLTKYYIENFGENSLDCKKIHFQNQIIDQSTPQSLMAMRLMTAAKVFRNCCGGGECSANRNTICQMTHPKMGYCSDADSNQLNAAKTIDFSKKTFQGLYSMLKESQIATLLQAVVNRQAGGGVGGAQVSSIDQRNVIDCVLVPRELILGQEPNVIACRLWVWSDLKYSFELKRVPLCPNEKDRVYVCCNPNHWSRRTLPDTPPPPYQSSIMERLQNEDHGVKQSLNHIGNSYISKSSSTNSLRLQFPSSLPTDGEENLSTTTWCQLAYWELAERVGNRFFVDNSSINIFSSEQTHGDGGMCLKTLANEKKSITPESVLKARKKIGLGVTLSQEEDGVWIYNRSRTAIFVHSPTLNDVDCWFHVSKVPPGYCLKAFDNYRARTHTLKWPPQIAGAQTGPVDVHSMRISFAKGWGPNYSRQDITACPCWLEVIFTHR